MLRGGPQQVTLHRLRSDCDPVIFIKYGGKPGQRDYAECERGARCCIASGAWRVCCGVRARETCAVSRTSLSLAPARALLVHGAFLGGCRAVANALAVNTLAGTY